MTVLAELISSAERRWLESWTAGPTEDPGRCLLEGELAPDCTLLDHTGASRRLSEFWTTGAALVLFGGTSAVDVVSPGPSASRPSARSTRRPVSSW